MTTYRVKLKGRLGPATMTATYTVQAEGNVDAHQEAKSLFYAEARKAGRAGIVTSTTILSEAQ